MGSGISAKGAAAGDGGGGWAKAAAAPRKTFAKGAAFSDGGGRNTDVNLKMIPVAKQHDLAQSQRNATQTLRVQMQRKFIFAGDAEETAKGEFEPLSSTLAQRAYKLLVKAERKAEQPATSNWREGKAIDYTRKAIDYTRAQKD